MKKISLKENPEIVVKEPFSFRGPVKPSRGGEFAIYRDFPLVVTPEMINVLKLHPSEIEDINASGGILDGEHEIFIDIESRYNKGYRQTWEDPGEPAGYEVDDYYPEAIDGIDLDMSDAKRLKEYLGDLTDDERQRVEEYLADQGPPERDWDDFRDDSDY